MDALRFGRKQSLGGPAFQRVQDAVNLVHAAIYACLGVGPGNGTSPKIVLRDPGVAGDVTPASS